MRLGQPIIVFPGGGDEVCKKRSHAKYALLWKSRKGFAKYATKFGYPILPAASVGFEDMLSVWFDIPVGWVMKLLGDKRSDFTVPFPFYNFTVQRCYYRFGSLIETASKQKQWMNDSAITEIRDITHLEVQRLIGTCQIDQKNDPNRYLLNEITNTVTRRHLVGGSAKKK